MSRIIAVANQKGGVGKTTTTINLATALAMDGFRVLLVDVDPQGNLTSGVGCKGQHGPSGSVYEAMTQQEPADDVSGYVVDTPVERLAILPTDRNLTGAEIELVALPFREERLRRLLTPVRERFDYVLIDCPPSLGLLTLNALVAADSVLIPLHCEYFALEGLADLVGTMRRVRGSLNPSLEIDGVLLTMYDDRTKLGQQVADGAVGHLGRGRRWWLVEEGRQRLHLVAGLHEVMGPARHTAKAHEVRHLPATTVYEQHRQRVPLLRRRQILHEHLPDVDGAVRHGLALGAGPEDARVGQLQGQ